MTGAVASAHPLSTRIGQSILAEGGNAYDATVAVSAALTVVQPHMNGLGSDFFAVVDDDGVRSINGSGWAAADATVEAFRSKGLGSIPAFGPLSSFMVPGLVGVWSLLARRTTRPFRDLISPAVRLARGGFPATPSIARAVAETLAHSDDDWKAIYAGLRPGVTLRQPALARTLEAIGSDEGESFYHGAIARQIERDMRAKGGLLRAADLEGYQAEWTSPLRVRYRGYDVYAPPPNSQGATALIWLNLLNRDELSGVPEPAYIATLLRSMEVAYRYRSRYIADPRVVEFPKELLAESYRYEENDRWIPPKVPGGGDTTAFSVFDGKIGVSAIQSNYREFGSGQTVHSTGINLNDRGSYFTLDPSHHNAVGPGRRTFHTLMALVVLGPGRRLLLGSMGGDVQPQVNVQVLTRLLDRGESISSAISAPRFAWPATIYGGADLIAEEGLEISGARLETVDRSLFGHAHAVDCRERIEVGIDPRGDGLVPAPLDGDFRPS